jgi:glycine oxidase
VPTHSEVVVVGAGIIGMACAWRLAQRGRSVTVIDPAPGSGATWTAAGMLAPLTELHYGEEALLRLNLIAAQGYPEVIAELEAATNRDVGYLRCGTVQAAWDAADLATLRDLHARQNSLGLRSELLTQRELRRLEPGLASGLPGALFVENDHQIDNRALHAALFRAALDAGARFVTEPVAALLTTGGAVTGAATAEGHEFRADSVVLAAGAHSRHVAGLPEDALPPVRPVKGQTLRVRTTGAAPISRVVRGLVKGSPVYLVPRANGEIVVGATSEEVGFDARPRTGAVYELLRDAIALLPELSEAEWLEVSTGLRPATPDNAPIVGPSSTPGLIVATGHYRNGVLLAPITADAVAALVNGEPVPAALEPFGPDRFEPVRSRL